MGLQARLYALLGMHDKAVTVKNAVDGITLELTLKFDYITEIRQTVNYFSGYDPTALRFHSAS